MTIILKITTRIIVLTQNQSPRNRNHKRSLRELRVHFYTCRCWPCNNMPLIIISLCCLTSSCSDTRSDMCKSSDYSWLALLSCKPVLVRGHPSLIHYFRAAGDAGLQSEPFSKQTSDSSLFWSVAVGCQIWVREVRSSAFCFANTGNTSTHSQCVISSLKSGRDLR